MLIRATIERVIGVRPELFEGSVSYESTFRNVALSALYFPLFEELLFRGVPFYLFGTIGAILGSIVWVVMHPAWQLQFISSLPLRKKIIFTLSSSGYYVANAIFYCMIWMDGSGLVAILYHMFHNGWLTLANLIREIELPTPWKQYKFVKSPKSEKWPRPPFVIRKTRGSLVSEAKSMFVKRKS